MYSTLYVGETHHKLAVSEYKILDIYYKTKYVLFIMCLTSEVIYTNHNIKNFHHYKYKDSYG